MLMYIHVQVVLFYMFINRFINLILSWVNFLFEIDKLFIIMLMVMLSAYVYRNFRVKNYNLNKKYKGKEQKQQSYILVITGNFNFKTIYNYLSNKIH